MNSTVTREYRGNRGNYRGIGKKAAVP